MTLWTLLRLVGALPVQDPAILGIYLGDDIQHPDWGGKKVYTSIGGGVRIRLKVKGFASDLRQEALQILLKDNSGATVHYKPYDEADSWCTASTTYLCFIAPHLDTVRRTTVHSRRTYNYCYNIEFQIKGHHQKPVECQTKNECKLCYSYGYTPQLDHIDPGVALSGQTIRFRLKHNGGVDVLQKQDGKLMATTAVKINGQNCDFYANELITGDSDIQRNQYRSYPCKLDDFKFVKDGVIEQFDAVGRAEVLYSAQTCFIDGSCVHSRILPSVTSLSHSIANKEGGLDITLRGTALNITDTQVEVGGQPCQIVKAPEYDTDKEDYVLTCRTQKGEESPSGHFPGGHGWTRKVYKNAFLTTDLSNKTPDKEDLLLNAEIPLNEFDERYISIASTFFKPSRGGIQKYRFRMAQDDHCDLYIHNTRPNTIPSDKSEMTLLLRLDKATAFRQFYEDYNEQKGTFENVSEWMPLDGTKLYYMEMWYQNYGGLGHCTVALEVYKDQPNHGQNVPNVQRVGYTYNANKDHYKFKLYRAGKALTEKFQIAFKIEKAAGTQNELTADIELRADTNTFFKAVEPYFQKKFGNSKNLIVSKRYLKADGNTVADSPEASVIIEFTIKVTTLKDGARETALTKPEIRSFNLDLSKCEASFIEGDDPVKGEWTLDVYDPETQAYIKTATLPPNAEAWLVQGKIEGAVDSFLNRIKVQKQLLTNPDGSEKGHAYVVSFDGYRKPVELMKVDTSKLYFGRPNGVDGSGKRQVLKMYNVNAERKVLQEYSTKVLYVPAPYQMFFTPHKKPQLKLTSGGIQSACQTSCDFEYINSSPQLNSYTTNNQFTQITLSGTNLASSTITARYFAGKLATAYNPSTHVMTITAPDAGKHVPSLYEQDKGFIAVNAFKTEIPPIVSSLSPTDVYRPGGLVLTITGDRFPTDGSKVTEVFIAQKKCDDMRVVSRTKIECTVPELGGPGAKRVTVKVDGVLSQNQVDVNVIALSPRALVLPESERSTFKRNLDITITGITETLSNINDYSVRIENAEHKIRMKVNEHKMTPDGKNQIRVRYPGGFIGDYMLTVNHTKYGTLERRTPFRVGATVESISVDRGSLAGGMLVTVTGKDFDPEKSKIYFGRIPCSTVGTSTTTQVSCYSPPTPKQAEDGSAAEYSAEIGVVTEVADDVTCKTQGACTFYWKSGRTPQVTDSKIEGTTLTITGSGFGPTKGKIKVMLDGIEQDLQEFSDTRLVAQLSEFKASRTDLLVGVNVTDKGAAIVKLSASKVRPFSPTFKRISPSEGSAGGSKLTITGDFFPQNYQGQVQFKDGTVICESVTYVSRTELSCISVAKEFAQQGTQLKSTDGHVTNCGNCPYETSATVTPKVIQITDNGFDGKTQTINLLGSNFPSAVTAKVWVDNVEATSVTISSTSQIVAAFENGAGFVTNVSPVVQFSNGHRATISATHSLAFEAASDSAAVVCSFAGGCEVSFSGKSIGLDSQVKVEVAGYECAYTFDANTPDAIKCTVPGLPSRYALTAYPEFVNSLKWHESKFVKQISPSSVSKLEGLFDGSPATSVTVDERLTEACWVGLEVEAGYAGIVEGVRFLFNGNQNTNHYVDGVVEALSGNSWTTLYTVTSPPVVGWNTLDTNCALPAANPYTKVRYRAPAAYKAACKFLELEVSGKVVYGANSDTVKPPVTFVRRGVTLKTLTNVVSYEASSTPRVTSISTKYVNLNTPTDFTVKGMGLQGLNADTKVLINGKAQTVTSVANTEIKLKSTACGAEKGESTFEITVKGKGRAMTQGQTVLCAFYWSDENIWQGEFAPGEGDTAVIPKGMHLIVDADSVPRLRAVIIQGSLIFLPNKQNPAHKRTFAADYIFVDGGHLQIGTEQEPYTSKFELTLHGSPTSASIPMYGNKVIAVRFGVIDIHGVDPNPSWQELAKTANPGDNSITLNTKNEISWSVGDRIAIAPTAFDFKQTDECAIKSKSKDSEGRPVLGLDCVLKHQHYSGAKKYGSDTLTMRAEVGLLSRNVVIQGDESSMEAQYGGHIMVHSPGDESSIGRIENAEFRRVGQAFKLGRYPIHFHMIGFTRKSYIKNNAVHHTFNRAVTIHGVHCLNIQNNVAFHTKGHTFFIEDAAETKNKLVHNLAIRTDASNSLLNTDSTPASFWITHPNNDFIDNHAAGAKRYGFWFDLQPNAMGPSASEHVCPVGERLGQFRGNVAHSNGRYGLRIFHDHIPRKYPCEAISRGPKENEKSEGFTEEMAFGDNPAVPAVYKDFLSYKNGRAGIIAEKIGAVQFVNIQVADNMQSGIEVTLPGYAKHGLGFVENALVVGFSDNTKGNDQNERYHGITTGQRDSFKYKNIRFYDFDGNVANPNAAAIGTCSHCSFTQNLDGFANTYEVEQLSFEKTTRRLLYEKGKTIFHDIDGSLSGTKQKRWVTKSWPHLVGNQCVEMAELDNSVVCFAKVLKLLIHEPEPVDNLKGMKLHVAKLGDQDDATKTSVISQNRKQVFWEVQFVAGREYAVFWDNGLDFTNVTLKRTAFYSNQYSRFILHFNYTDVRETFTVTGRKAVAPVGGGLKLNVNHPHGTSYHDKNNKRLSVFISEVPADGGFSKDSDVKVAAGRCSGTCTVAPNPNEVEAFTRSWNNPFDWRENPNDSSQQAAVPGAGATIVIKPTWNMVYDVTENPPEFAKVVVHGKLSFKDPTGPTKQTVELKTKQLIIDTGELSIGTKEVSYKNNAVITLLGEQNDPTHAFSDDVQAGNKILFVSGNLTLHGSLSASRVRTRLLAKAVAGSNSLSLPTGLGWVKGQKIVIGPTSYDYKEHEMLTIVSYDNGSGATVVEPKLNYNHFGALASEADGQLNYDFRAEVGLVSRNIKIQGDQRRWGGQVFVAEWVNSTSNVRYAGNAWLKNVELSRLSQHDTLNAAIRTVDLKTYGLSLDRCSIHSSQGLGVFLRKSKGVSIKDSVIYETHRNAILVRESENLVLQDNLIMYNRPRAWDSAVKGKDFQTAVDICVGEQVTACKNYLVKGNWATGGAGIGFTAPVDTCDKTAQFSGNTVHSYEAGWIAHYNEAEGKGHCGQIADFVAHHNSDVAIQSFYYLSSLKVSRVVVADNMVGLSLGLGNGDNPDGEITLENSLVMGEHAATQNCAVDAETGNKKVGLYSAFGIARNLSLPYVYPKLGFHHVGQDAARGKLMTIKDVKFTQFNQRGCGVSNAFDIFQLHPEASDLVMEHRFQDITLENVATANFMHLMDAPGSWSALSDCVGFPCTAPDHVLLSFSGNITPRGITNLGLPATPFQIIHKTDSLATDKCTVRDEWNAYVCEGESLALLQFESKDPDTMERSVQPVFLKDTSTGGGIDVKLNSFMDHIWDGFYTGSRRLSRFVSLIRHKPQTFYNITYTGTPPLGQLFELYGAKADEFYKIRIDYPNPDMVQVFKDGKAKLPNALADGVSKALKGDQCGENRWDPVASLLEFTIQGANCDLELRTSDSIQMSFRMQTTMTQFFAAGGTDRFVQNLAASLDINTSRIRILGVYKGSVVVDTQIATEETAGTKDQQISELTTVKDKVQTKVNDGSLDVGAPVLDFTMSVSLFPTGVITNPIKTGSSGNGGSGGTGTVGNGNGNGSGVNGGGSAASLNMWHMGLIVVATILLVTAVILLIHCHLRRKRKMKVAATENKFKIKTESFRKCGMGINTISNQSVVLDIATPRRDFGTLDLQTPSSDRGMVDMNFTKHSAKLVRPKRKSSSSTNVPWQ